MNITGKQVLSLDQVEERHMSFFSAMLPFGFNKRNFGIRAGYKEIAP